MINYSSASLQGYVFGMIILLASLLPTTLLQAQNFDLGFSNVDVDCQGAEICYDITIASADAAFDLGSFNLRFFYHCGLVTLNETSPSTSLPSAYQISNIRNVCADASGLGQLDFESTLGFSEIAIDYTPSTPISVSQTPVTIVEQICFNTIDDALINDPAVCLPVIWVNQNTNTGYTNSVTTLNVATGGTLSLATSSYTNLDDDNNCITDLCDSSDPCIPIVDMDGDGVCDEGDNPDPDPNNPCVPNNVDADGDGVCDIGNNPDPNPANACIPNGVDADQDGVCDQGANADPDPNDPCIPNFVDRDQDGVCDLGVNADPDPTNPCIPNISAPTCLNSDVSFELSFSQPDVDCQTDVICYQVFMKALNINYSLGSYNLRLFYDGDVLDALDASPSLDAGQQLTANYSIISVNDMDGGDQSSLGSLAFDDHLKLLDIAIDYTGAAPLLIDSNEVAVLYELCFAVADPALFMDSDVCADAVWVNALTAESYTNAITTVNIASPSGVTVDLENSVYSDLDDDSRCFELICFEDACAVLACNDRVNISLDTCVVKVDYDSFLEDALPAVYSVAFFDENDAFVRTDSLYASDAGELYRYEVSCLDNSCWGEVLVEINVIPEIELPCGCETDATVPTNCKIFCNDNHRVPQDLVTKAELLHYLDRCGVEEILDVQRHESIIDTLCDSGEEIIEIEYIIKKIAHGNDVITDRICQRYARRALPVDKHEFDIFFNFPDDAVLECYDAKVTAAIPDTILSRLQDITRAYPYYIDLDSIKTEKAIVNIDTITITTFTALREKLVAKDIDNDGEDEWIIIQEAAEMTRDSFVKDTIDVEVGFQELPIIDKLCNVVVSYSDTEFPICGSSKKIIRDWTFYDWCSSTTIKSESQLIHIQDTKAPSLLQMDEHGHQNPISFINDAISYLDPWVCTGSFPLPDVLVEDACDEVVDIRWETNVGIVQDGIITNIPKNNVPVQVKAILSDDCGNQSNIFFNVAVLDTIKPVASCIQDLTVNLSTDFEQINGFAQIYARDLSGGSNDLGCDSITLSVLRILPRPNTVPRLGTEFASFNCQDLGKDIRVALVVQDEAKNRSSCEVKIKVENDFTPRLMCEDQVIDCGEENRYRPEIIGDFCRDFGRQIKMTESSAVLSCSTKPILQEWYIDLNQDDRLSIDEPSCEYKISFSDSSKFEPSTIKWPKHYNNQVITGILLECKRSVEVGIIEDVQIAMGESADCLSDAIAHQAPIWCASDCGLVASSVKTDTVASAGACYKIINKWTIIDWCTYDPNTENNEQSDKFIAVEDWSQGECADCDKGYGPPIQDSVYFMLEEFERDGYYSYNQIITVVDTLQPVLSIMDTVRVDLATGCIADVRLTAIATEGCGQSDVANQSMSWQYQFYKNGLLSEVGQERGASITIDTDLSAASINNYIIWSVKDGCGNTSRDTSIIIVNDNEAPTPICAAGLSSQMLVDTGGMVWANDFNLSSSDNCTAAEELRYTIVANGVSPIKPGESGFENQTSINVTCDSLNEILSYDVWVWDAGANGSKCDVELRINHECTQSNSMAQISGRVHTMYGSDFSNVGVSLHMNEQTMQTHTDAAGRYSFAHVPMGHQVQLKAAYHADQSIEGVSTLDIILIQQHILGMSHFESPYQYFAADANGDQKITAADIVNLQRELLSFEGRSEWKFFDAQIDYEARKPWPAVADISLHTDFNQMSNHDFIGIKLGDVNGSMRHAAESRSETLGMSVADVMVQPEEVVTVKMKIESSTELMGMQLELALDGLSLLSLRSDAAGFNESNRNVADSRAKLVYMNDQNDDKQISITMTLRGGERPIRLSDALILVQQDLVPEVYTAQRESIGLSLDFTPSAASSLAVGQNYPNPFRTFSLIDFQVPAAGQVSLSIFNVAGGLIYQQEGYYEKGHHQFEINDDMIPETGIFQYVIEAKDQRVSKTLMKL